MNGKKYAAAYIRVSTDDQVEYSPDTQLKCIAEFARKNGYILPDELVFRDDGISGRSVRRPYRAHYRVVGRILQYTSFGRGKARYERKSVARRGGDNSAVRV